MGSKKDKTTMWVVVLAVVAIGGIMFATGVFDDPQSASVAGADSATPATTESCPDTQLYTEKVRAYDTMSPAVGSNTYVAGSIFYAKDLTGRIIGNATTISTVDFTNAGTSNSLPCGSGITYQVVTQNGVATSAVPTSKATAGVMTAEALVQQLSYGQTMVVDLKSANTYLTAYAPGLALGANSSSYSALNSTEYYVSSPATNKSVGASEEINYKVILSSATANKFFNEVGESWVTIDGGTASAWATPSVTVAGVTLVENKAGIDADSQTYTYITNAEYAFPFERQIGSGDTEIQIRMSPRGSTNPTAADSPFVCIWSEGVYKSSKVPDTFKKGIATDASTQVPVVHSTAYLPCFKIHIA